MKTLKIYEINDGIDGVVIAKSLKQAVKKLVPFYGYTAKEIVNSLGKDESHYSDFTLTGLTIVAKKGVNKKSKIVGWCES